MYTITLSITSDTTGRTVQRTINKEASVTDRREYWDRAVAVLSRSLFSEVHQPYTVDDPAHPEA